MKEQYISKGGYVKIRENIIRSNDGVNKHTAVNLNNIGETTIQALNQIQATPWSVNPFTLSVIEKLVSEGKDVGFLNSEGEFEVVFRIQEPLSPYLEPKHKCLADLTVKEKEAMSDTDWKDRSSQKVRILSRYESQVGVYRATKRIVDLAGEMSEHRVFYYPHALDFRTRIYPIPTDLTPQGNDLSKGLLQFGRGMKLGHEGLFWLGVMVATHAGFDKLSPAERFDKASEPEFFAMLCRVVADPVGNKAEWIKTDAPLQFLAAANEFVSAVSSDKPADFISYLPGALDGSCNGMQHLSVMARDTVGATATNCRAGLNRNDLYQEVAERVFTKVQEDAAAGDSLAIEVLPRLLQSSSRRNVVKRATMTQSYGVTEFGITRFMIDDDHVEGLPDEWNSAKYLKNCIVRALDETLQKGRALQGWFASLANKCAVAGKPFVFDTPAGSTVVMGYYYSEETRVKTLNTNFVVYNKPKPNETLSEFYDRIGLNSKKMRSSASPNVVHAHDAAHLQLTVVEMSKKGIRDFAMVHDAYGTHMCNIGLMRDILRKQMVSMYSGDYLTKFKQSVEKHSGLNMGEIPETGDFDITEILNSEYFFS